MTTSFDRKIQEAVDDPIAMQAAVREGLEIGWFDHLAKLFGVSGSVFAQRRRDRSEDPHASPSGRQAHFEGIKCSLPFGGPVRTCS